MPARRPAAPADDEALGLDDIYDEPASEAWEGDERAAEGPLRVCLACGASPPQGPGCEHPLVANLEQAPADLAAAAQRLAIAARAYRECERALKRLVSREQEAGRAELTSPPPRSSPARATPPEASPPCPRCGFPEPPPAPARPSRRASGGAIAQTLFSFAAAAPAPVSPSDVPSAPTGLEPGSTLIAADASAAPNATRRRPPARDDRAADERAATFATAQLEMPTGAPAQSTAATPEAIADPPAATSAGAPPTSSAGELPATSAGVVAEAAIDAPSVAPPDAALAPSADPPPSSRDLPPSAHERDQPASPERVPSEGAQAPPVFDPWPPWSPYPLSAPAPSPPLAALPSDATVEGPGAPAEAPAPAPARRPRRGRPPKGSGGQT